MPRFGYTVQIRGGDLFLFRNQPITIGLETELVKYDKTNIDYSVETWPAPGGGKGVNPFQLPDDRIGIIVILSHIWRPAAPRRDKGFVILDSKGNRS